MMHRNSQWEDEVIDLENRVTHLLKKIEAVTPIIREITEGKGRYNRDHLTHCTNAVEDMKTLAVKALEVLEAEP